MICRAGSSKRDVYKRQALAFASALCVILPAGAASSARYGKEDFWVAAQGIVQWKKQETGSAGDNLLEGAFLESAGTTGGDWYPIAMGRMEMCIRDRS